MNISIFLIQILVCESFLTRQSCLYRKLNLFLQKNLNGFAKKKNVLRIVKNLKFSILNVCAKFYIFNIRKCISYNCLF